MAEHIVILRPSYVCSDTNNFYFSDFVYAHGFTAIDPNQSSKYF